MAAATDERLQKCIKACEAAHKVVVRAEVDGSVIRLFFADQAPARLGVDPDLIDWRKKK